MTVDPIHVLLPVEGPGEGLAILIPDAMLPDEVAVLVGDREVRQFDMKRSPWSFLKERLLSSSAPRRGARFLRLA